MERRTFVAGMAAATMAPRGAESQQPGRIYRIGYLHPGIMPAFSTPVREAFDRTLAEFGFVLGQNVVEEGRAAAAEKAGPRDFAKSPTNL